MEASSTTSRLEKKIDQMQSDIRMLSDHVTRLTFINEAHQNSGAENRKDLDAVGEKVRHLEHYTSRLNGGVNVLRYIVGLVSGTILGMGLWFGGQVIDNGKEIVGIKKEIIFIHQHIYKNGDK